MLDGNLARDAAIDAARCILQVAQELAPPSSVVEIAAGDVRVVIRRTGSAPSVSALTPCERDLLGLLRLARTPWTTVRILRELDAAGAVHGEATVKRALARLVAAGRLTNSRRPPRGYALPAPSPARLDSA